MAQLSPINSSHRSIRHPGRRAIALVGVVALLLAAGTATLGGSGHGSAGQPSMAQTQIGSTAPSGDAYVSVLESAARTDTQPVLEIATAARQEAAVPAASGAAASAPDTAEPAASGAAASAPDTAEPAASGTAASAPDAAEPAASAASASAQEAAAPAASQAIASAPDTGVPAVASEALSPVQRWAAQGIDLVTQGEEWDDQSIANVDAALSALPPSLLSSLGNPALGQMQIVVNREGRELSGTQPYGGPANFFSTNDGINELVLYPGQSAFTVLHELGHAYNLRRTPAGRYALVLLDPEMQSFMAATGWHVLSTEAQVRAAIDQIGVSYSYDGSFMWSNLSHRDPLEDFANSFAMYFLDPANLNSLSPARYAWFAANIGR